MNLFESKMLIYWFILLSSVRAAFSLPGNLLRLEYEVRLAGVQLGRPRRQVLDRAVVFLVDARVEPVELRLVLRDPVVALRVVELSLVTVLLVLVLDGPLVEVRPVDRSACQK